MSTAQQTFELENGLTQVHGDDELFQFDAAKQKEIRNDAPWQRDAHFFKRARISAIALIKMVTHARSGGAIEVMGLMQGKVTADGEIIVLDAFALPVEGTETRVNAGAEAYEYMIGYGTGSEQVSRPENVVGWYHSHPGYGCWLSGIDVGTQKENQLYQDPWLAVVIDPNRTVSAGAVELGAFRTFPEEYKASDNAASGYQNIPLEKVEDFGAHASQYYALEVQYFKSSFDAKLLEALWNKYWITTLSQSTLVSNREYTTAQMHDLTMKIQKYTASSTHRFGGLVGGAGAGANNFLTGMSPSRGQGSATEDAPRQTTEHDGLCRDMAVIAAEEQHGAIAQKLKERLFNIDLSSRSSEQNIIMTNNE